MKLFKTAALAVAVSMMGLAVAGDAMALPSEGYRTTYYQQTESGFAPVGHETLACNGAYSTTGVQTAISNTEYTLCADRSQQWTLCDVPEFCWF